MKIRKASPKDIDAIEAIYEATHDAEESGRASIGWIRGIYPTRRTAADSLARGDLFVIEAEDDSVAGAAIINQSQVDCYAGADWMWQAENTAVMVLHTLVIDPARSGQGFGKAFVAFYEAYARERGCAVVRMDTNCRNKAARALYQRLGYREAGIVPCTFNGIPGVDLVLLEKKLGLSIPDPQSMEKDMTQAQESKERKKALRRAVFARIDALSAAYKTAADEAIRAYLLTLPEYRAARTVFCFVSDPREIDTIPFLEKVLADGKLLCVPLCVGKHTMQARQITGLDQLKSGCYGLLEPDPAAAPLVAPEEIDLAVIPCVSCSHEGVRLGHGGGFYDVFFSENPTIPTAMICREQIITADIPREAHDLLFPLVVTEQGVFRQAQNA